MTLQSHEDLQKLRAIGAIVRLSLEAMSKAARPGMTTAELDAVCAAVLDAHGAEPSPAKVYAFPGTACISVNEEAVHGIPGERRLADGDLVKCDVTAEKDGYVADAAVTVRVGRVGRQADALARCAESAFRQGLAAARPGNRVRDIGRAVEDEVRRWGFSVVRELCGHGVGRSIHEEPCVPNFCSPRARETLTEGLVLTIEPIIAAGSGKVRVRPDKWTVVTRDHSLSAHYEHTLVVSAKGPLLLTAA
jgi:methionyl aminopeptidase